jgi:hypothetical protein
VIKSSVASVIRHADLQQLSLCVHQEKTLRALTQCRTAALGGHIDACDACGNVRISYNSCRNRHCPNCQGHKRMEWVQKREQDLLPCSYYHLVFTLPHELNKLAMYRSKMLYDALFASVWATLHQFGKSANLLLGMIGVLHTWGQNLSLHPHLHCIVPGGGIDDKGQWQRQLRSNKYLFSVKAMSKVFRARMVACLRLQGIVDKGLIESLFAKEWVVYAKKPFGGPKQVIQYLGRYTHKVAIGNQRIKLVTESEVVFEYRDYKDGSKQKEMRLSNEEFVRRFAQHILPKRFVRIRHYGIISSSWKRGKLQALQASLKQPRPVYVANTMLGKCPCCKTGNLVVIEVFGSRGPPAIYLLEKQTVPQT